MNEPPQKVRRAIGIPAFRGNWLPTKALADPEATVAMPGQEVRYRLRNGAPPVLESTVTFRIAPNGAGGTSLRIIHELTDARFKRIAKAAANSSGPPLMPAA